MLRKKYRKNITFSAPIKKEIVNDNDEENDDDDDDDDDDDSKKEEEVNDCDIEEKEIVNSKQEEDNNSKKKKKTTYKIQFIDSYRLMPSKLSNLFDNLSGIFNKESEKCRERKKIRVESKFIGFRNNRLNCRCKE